MTEVVRIRNPEFLELEPAQALFGAAIRGTLFGQKTFAEVKDDLAAAISDPRFGVFVGVEGGKMRGVMWVTLPSDNLASAPQVPIFYVDGRLRALKEALIREGISFVVNGGHTSFWALNLTGRSDKVWARAFERAGPAKRLGSIMEFKIG